MVVELVVMNCLLHVLYITGLVYRQEHTPKYVQPIFIVLVVIIIVLIVGFIRVMAQMMHTKFFKL